MMLLLLFAQIQSHRYCAVLPFRDCCREGGNSGLLFGRGAVATRLGKHERVVVVVVVVIVLSQVLVLERRPVSGTEHAFFVQRSPRPRLE